MSTRAAPRLFAAAAATLRAAVVVSLVRAGLGAAAAVVLGAMVGAAAAARPTGSHLLIAGGLLAVRGLLAGVGPLMAARTVSRVEGDLRRRVLDAVLAAGPWTGRRTGEVVSKATEGVEATAALAGNFLPQLISGMAAPMLLLGVVALIDWPIALALAVFLPTVPVALRLLERRFASVSARYRERADELAARFVDGIQGLRTLRSLGRAEDYGDELESESERLRLETMNLLRVNQLALLAVDSLFTLGTVVAAAVLAAWRLSSGVLSVGEAVAVVVLGVMLIEPLAAIGRFFYVGAIGRAAADQIRGLLEGGVMPAATSPDVVPTGEIRLEAVRFAYPGGAEALSGVTLTVKAGERVALVGPSGAGKTTLAHLILGLLIPDAGTVAVGGRRALVAQRPYLFYGTVADNLRLADPDATATAMWDALEAADLADTVRFQGAGLETLVGERGLRLSVGEAQRLAIARALLRAADVVVLDEPTSNVDLDTESRIRTALDRLFEGRTVVIIAHRRSTIAGVDRVVTLGEGRVVSDTAPSENGR